MAPLSDIDVPLLPEGTRLLHIGPHKTGTTSLQGALWTTRESMRAQGVRHVGPTRNPSNAVRAVVGQPSPYSDSEPPSISHWRLLVRELKTAREPRVVVSSEFFSWAKPEAIRRILDDVGPERVHIAVTLRPLARIIPSMWQQNIQAGQVGSLDHWLEGVLKRERANQPFWTLHRHDRLIERWAEVVGRDRVTAVIVDERDHAFQLRVFERLLGLREDTLAVVHDFTNRSLTLPEAEAVRAFNVAFRAEGLPRAVHARLMRFGAAQEMKRREPAPDEPRAELPAWAEERVAEIALEVTAGIRASGVRVVGDLETLTAPAPRRAAATEHPLVIPPEIAASMAMGIVIASGAARRRAAGAGPLQMAEPIELARMPTTQVGAYLVLRAGRSISVRWRRLRGAIARG